MLPHLHRMLGLTTALTLASACRTTKPQEATTSSDPKAAAVSGGATGVQFSKDDEQALYLQMLTVETNAGIKVAKEQLHTSRGLIECRRVGSVAPCTLRVRLDEAQLSSSQPLPKKLTPGLWAFAEANQPDLKTQNLVLMSLVCDYLGKKSPPYDVTSVACKVSLPRSDDEAVFLGKAAEELSEGIRGNTAYGPKLVTLSGAVSCQWLKLSPRTPCIVRAQVGGVLQEKITEMSPGVAAEVARSLKQAAADHAKINTPPEAQPAKPRPEEGLVMVAALSCLVDNTTADTDGKRSYVCRAKI